MNIQYQCTQCGNAGEIEAQVNAQTGVITLPGCPNCGKQLYFGLDIPTQGIVYETTFGDEQGAGEE